MNQPLESVVLSRDCEAIQIPHGAKTLLPKGTPVHITQALGGSFTIMTDMGYLIRIEGKDADALGKTPPPPPTVADTRDTASVEQKVWDQMRTCYDPEIPVNIVDLGLIYACRLDPVSEGKHRASIQMTLTAPGCGMGQTLCNEVQSKVATVPGIESVDVQLVWEPPWDRGKMSDAAKLQFGMM